VTAAKTRTAGGNVGRLFVRLWHKAADIGLRGHNVCFGGKAGIIRT
jgi:hypothetical protein